MPYIKQERRKDLDNKIYLLANELSRRNLNDGEVNYVVSSLINKLYCQSGKNYMKLQRAIGLLECVKQEVYRRVVSPYEDDKIKENGDVF